MVLRYGYAALCMGNWSLRSRTTPALGPSISILGGILHRKEELLEKCGETNTFTNYITWQTPRRLGEVDCCWVLAECKEEPFAHLKFALRLDCLQPGVVRGKFGDAEAIMWGDVGTPMSLFWIICNGMSQLGRYWIIIYNKHLALIGVKGLSRNIRPELPTYRTPLH